MGNATPNIYRPLAWDEVYVKVGNFGWMEDSRGRVALILNAGDYHTVNEEWVLCPKLQAGMPGGSATLFDPTRLIRLGAFDFRKESTWPDDVKFSIHRNTIGKLSKIFSVREKSAVFECSPTRELREEFAQETFPGLRETPILSASDVTKMSYWHCGTFMHETKSERPEDEGKNLHISRVSRVEMPKSIMSKLKKADSVIFFPTAGEMKVGEMLRDGVIVPISKKARFIYQCMRGETVLCDVRMIR